AFPRADLDQNAFPRAVLEAFQRARDSVEARATGRPPARADSRDEGIGAAYARFQPPDGDSPAADDRWANGPIRYLMSKSEKVEWDRIRDPAERAAFVVKFWQARDPNPLTPENELRAEFERRIRFSDANFSVEEKRGSETDRGLVFALLGPPAYIAQFSLMSQDDPLQVAHPRPDRESTLTPPNRRSSTGTTYV